MSNMSFIQKLVDFVGTFEIVRYFLIFIGQSCSDANGRLVGIKTLAYNVIYIILFFLCFIINAYTLENKLGYEGYTFVSRMNFCCNIYITPLLAITINILIIKNRKQIATCYASRKAFIDELNAIQINRFKRLTRAIVMLCIEIPISILFFILDISLHGSNFSIFFWICAYLPGVSITLYFRNIYIFLEGCRVQLVAINKYLEQFACTDLSCCERLLLNRKNTKPAELVKKIPGEQNTVFDKIFEQHSRICETVEKINETGGYPFLFLIGVGFTIWLSTFYNFLMDMLMVIQKKPRMTRTVYVCDFWAWAYAIGVILFFETCADLGETSSNTSIVLHKLQNLYPVLQESAEIYSLQLLHKKLTLTAAGYFVLERALLLEILATQATYFIILLQL